MSFLSSLFCCFDGDDSNRNKNSNSNSQSNSRPNTNSKANNSLSQTSTRHSNNKRPNLSKTQSNLQKALLANSSASATRNNSLANLTTLKSDSAKASSQKLDSNTGTGTGNTTVLTNMMVNTNINSDDYKEIIEEISDVKESTNSSKNEDDDDEILIHESNTQNTDENLNQINNTNLNPTDDTNPISNLNPNDINAKSSFAYDDQLFNEQFGVDLKEILPNQTVSPSGWLLDTKPKQFNKKKCLVLDLDETLVHSSFKFVRQCDFVIPVEIENQIHNVYVIKRPGVDKFMKRVGELFEVVVFTASVSRYGDPLLDILDAHNKSIHQRLFRDSCYNYQGNYIKNLSQMGRPLEDLIIIDNSPASYVFHPQHAVPISSWFSDSHDCELSDLLPFLEDLAKQDVDDVRLVLDINL